MDGRQHRAHEVFEPDAPPEERDEAAGNAFLRAFGCNWLRQLADEYADDEAHIEAIYSGTALEDIALLDYPEHHRELIRRLGRPDFEHSKASDYNRALVGGAMCLEELGKGDPESLKVLQACLWPAFFSEPCPE